MFALCEQCYMKQLQAYLSDTGTPQARFAEMIGISRAYMSELVAGTKTPSLSVASAIERATGGSIKASAWADKTSRGPERHVNTSSDGSM